MRMDARSGQLTVSESKDRRRGAEHRRHWRRPAAGRVILLAAIVTASFGMPAHAGIGAGNGEFGFDFGYMKYDSITSPDSFGLFSGFLDYHRGDGVRFDLRGGYHFTSLFEIEGECATSHTGPNSNQNVQLSFLQVSGVLNFHPGAGNVVPYVLAGPAYMKLTSSVPDGEDTGQGWEAAVGSRFFFGDHDQVAVRLEVGRIFAKLVGTTMSDNTAAVGFCWRIGADRT